MKDVNNVQREKQTNKTVRTRRCFLARTFERLHRHLTQSGAPYGGFCAADATIRVPSLGAATFTRFFAGTKNWNRAALQS
jgi:hypothetical protein